MTDTALFSEFDTECMQQALGLAQQAAEVGEVPVGAVVVKDGNIIGEGFNRTIANHDPSAHAEMLALRAAGQQQNNYRLPGTTLYVTLEPCLMCAGLIIHARVQRIVFAAADPKTGAAGSCFDMLQNPQHNHRPEVESGLLEEVSGTLLRDFFGDDAKPVVSVSNTLVPTLLRGNANLLCLAGTGHG